MSKNKVENEEDDILIEDVPSVETEMQTLKESTRERKPEKKEQKEKKRYTLDELKKMISSFDPPKITDWPKRPLKTIFVILLLLSSSILFLHNSVSTYKDGKHTWKDWLPYGLLGGLLLIPGVYYSVFLIFILIGREGYNYEDLPDLSAE